MGCHQELPQIGDTNPSDAAAMGRHTFPSPDFTAFLEQQQGNGGGGTMLVRRFEGCYIVLFTGESDDSKDTIQHALQANMYLATLPETN